MVLEFVCAFLGFDFDSLSLFWLCIRILDGAVKLVTLIFLLLIIRDVVESRQRKG